MKSETQRGVAAGVAAYALWGLLPLYWKRLSHIPAHEILAHRVVWALVVLLLLAALSGRLRPALSSARDPKTALACGMSSLFVGGNWVLYVWGVSHERLVEVSLGYFINPLISVLFGVLFLGERLRSWQWASVICAGCGVLVLLLGSASLPWLSLLLASSFAGYGLVKKLVPLPALDSQLLETALLTPIAALWLASLHVNGRGALFASGLQVDLLLLCSGVATALPLGLFGAAARRIPLSVLGLLQYIAPSLQLALGVLLYGEPFGVERAAAFGLVWLGLLLFVADGLRSRS